MKKRYLLNLMCLVWGVMLMAPVQIMAQSCTELWQDAQAVMSNQCNDATPYHTACYAQGPLATIPNYGEAFNNPGELINISDNLDEIIGFPADNFETLGGFAYLKVIPSVRVEGVTYGSSISMVAFGRTMITDVESENNGTFLNANSVCDVSLRYGSTTFGGTYLRAIPDPGFTTACVTPGCTDKDNLLHFAIEGERLSVIGQDQTGNSYLVSDSHVTGWIPSSSTYIDASQCAGVPIPVKDDNIIQQMQAQTSEMPIVTKFSLVNEASYTSNTCLDQGRPIGGLLIINPADIQTAFTVNDLEIEIASSVFVWARPRTNTQAETSVLVLEGRAVLRNGNNAVQLVTGQSASFANGEFRFPDVNSRRVNWCEALTDLAQSIYQPEINGVAVGVPEERIDFCRTSPGNGYPVTFDMGIRIDG